MQLRQSDHGDVRVFHFAGRVDFEGVDALRGACQRLTASQPTIFDFSQLQFVGSVAIMPLLETVFASARRAQGQVRISGAGSEFQRLIAAKSRGRHLLSDNLSDALSSLAPEPREFSLAQTDSH